MATAGPDVTELISCPVCKDIYTDPKSLKCRHTLCGQCLDGLMAERRRNVSHSSFIKCPVCRETCTERDVRDDFKVREMVTLFGAHVSLPENHLCEWCEKNKLRWRCAECEAMICDDCKMVHEKVILKGKSARHQIQSVQELAQKLRMRLTESKNKIDSVLDTATRDLGELRAYRRHLAGNRGSVLARVDAEERQQMDAMAARFAALRRKVSSAVAEELTKTSYRMNAVQAAITGAHTKCSILGDTEDGAPPSITEIVVNYGAGDTDMSLMSLSDQWHAPAPSLRLAYVPPPPGTPTVTPLPPQQGLLLEEPDEASGKIELIRDYKPLDSADMKEVNFSDIITKRFDFDGEIALPFYCHSITLIGDDIWCAGFDNNKILTYSTGDMAMTDAFEYPLIEHPACIVDTSTITGRVLIGCSHDDGLHEVDMGGGYRQKIHKGSICDGTVYNDEVYVLQHQHSGTNTSHVLVFKHNGTTWVLQNDMELDYCRTSHNDTIAVNTGGIHITSWCNNNVLLYDAAGRFVRYEAAMPRDDPPPHPRFCQTDDHGSLLLCDSRHGVVYQLDSTQQWQLVQLPQLTSPRHVLAAACGDVLWALEHNGTRLLKYKTAQ